MGDFNALYLQFCRAITTLLLYIPICDVKNRDSIQNCIVATLRFHGNEQDLEQIGGLGCKIDISESDD